MIFFNIGHLLGLVQIHRNHIHAPGVVDNFVPTRLNRLDGVGRNFPKHSIDHDAGFYATLVSKIEQALDPTIGAKRGP